MKIFRLLPIYLSFVVLIAFYPECSAESALVPEVKATLLLDHKSVSPGQTFQAAVFLTHLNDWHSYWLNPGDSGLPTIIKWSLPPGFKVSDPRWTYPKRFFSDGLTNYGYSGVAASFTTIQLPAGLSDGVQVNLSAEVSWLACREVCVPQKQTVQASVMIDTKAAPADLQTLQLMQKMSNRLPKNDPSFQIDAASDKDYYWLHVVNSSNRIIPLTDMYFFDADREGVSHSSLQTVIPGTSGVYLKIPKFQTGNNSKEKLTGVLAIYFQNEKQHEMVYAIDVHSKIEDARNWGELQKRIKTPLNRFHLIWIAIAGLLIGFAAVGYLKRVGKLNSNLLNK